MPKVLKSIASHKLVELINGGAVGVIPTDTVYGLVARADNARAIAKMYSVKERPSQPGTIIGASIGQFEALGFPYDTLAVANHYWPASLSVVIDATNVKKYLKRDRGSLPVRIPDSPELLEILEKTGPLMTTSANHPGEPTSTTVAMAKQYFGDEVDFYVDGGDLSDRLPSTIIGISPSGLIEVYRHGAVEIDTSSRGSSHRS